MDNNADDAAKNSVVGQNLNKPIVLTDLDEGQGLAHMQFSYPLSELEFYKLKNSTSVTAGVALTLFGGWIGFVIGLGPKIALMADGQATALTRGEWQTIAAIGVLTLLVYVIGLCFPNERKKTISNIAVHFQSKPASSHIVRR